MNPYRLRAYIYFLIVVAIWGIAGPIIKVTLGVLPPDLFIFYRFGISFLVALIYFLIKGVKIPKDKTTRLQFAIYTIFNSFVTIGLLFWGTSKTSLLDMSLISLFGPLVIILGAYIFLKDRITHKEKVGIGITFTGALIISISPLMHGGNVEGQLIGNLLVFLSTVSGAFCAIMAKVLLRKGCSADGLAHASFSIGFLILLPFVLFKYSPLGVYNTFSNLDPLYIAAVVYMAIFSGTIAYIIGNKAQKSIEVSEAAPFSYLYPLVSAILAVVLLGDKITSIIILGTALTLIGVVIAESKKKLV